MPEQLSDQEIIPPHHDAQIATNFEPRAETKRYYYGVRKKCRNNWGRIKFPGLFDYEERFDKTCTWAVLLTEVIALAFLARIISESSQDIPLLLLAIGALAFLIFDLALAWGHHKIYYPCLSKYENLRLKVFPLMRAAGGGDMTYDDYCKQLRIREVPLWRKLVSWFCVFCIVLLALVKCFLYIGNVGVFFDNTQMPSKLQFGINGLVFLSYFFCVYAHIFHTGYYLGHLQLENRKAEDYKRFLKGIDRAARNDYLKKHQESNPFSLQKFVNDLEATGDSKYSELVTSDANELKKQIEKGINMDLSINKAHLGKHSIVKIEDKYIIKADGCLTDDQLEIMINNQKTELAKAAVALWGHHLQLKFLQD